MLGHQNKLRTTYCRLFLLLFIGGCFVTHPQVTHAALYNASGELGQYDDHDNQVFTASSTDNVRQPNGRGFNYTLGVALDAVNHRFFLEDCNNKRVLVFQLDVNNSPSSAVATNVLGQPDFNSNTAGTNQHSFGATDGCIEGTAFDLVNERLFVGDFTNSRVLSFNVAPGSIVNGENAINVLGQASFNTKIATTTRSGMDAPEAIAYDSIANRLFVNDFNNNRVLVYDVNPSTIVDGENALNVLGQPTFTTKTATTTQSGIGGPQGLAYDPQTNRLFVGDSYPLNNNRVLVLDVNPATITNGENALNVLGQSNFVSNIATTTRSGLNVPAGLGLDQINNRLFISDDSNNRIMVFNVATSTIANGENALTVLGQPTFTSSGVTTTRSGLNDPEGDMAYDPSTNKLFVPDSSNNRIMVFDANPTTITNGENALTEMGEYDDHDNPVYTRNAVNNVSQPNGRGFNYPAGATLDSANHRLFAIDTNNNRILVFQLDSGNDPASAIASYVLGQSDFNSSSFVTTQSGVGAYEGIIYDSQNQRLFASDTGNNRVLIFNVAPGIIANGENASYVIGQPNFTSRTATATQSSIEEPSGIAYDTVSKRLFVSDYDNSRIMVFNADPLTITNGENTINVLGQPNFTSSTATTTQSGLQGVQSLAYDSATNRLFAADYANDRVVIFNVATSTIVNGENASYVLGQPNFTSAITTSTQNGLSYLEGLGFDPTTNRLFVGDDGNNRIMIFNVAASTISNGENALNVLGQSKFYRKRRNDNAERSERSRRRYGLRPN